MLKFFVKVSLWLIFPSIFVSAFTSAPIKPSNASSIVPISSIAATQNILIVPESSEISVSSEPIPKAETTSSVLSVQISTKIEFVPAETKKIEYKAPIDQKLIEPQKTNNPPIPTDPIVSQMSPEPPKENKASTQSPDVAIPTQKYEIQKVSSQIASPVPQKILEEKKTIQDVVVPSVISNVVKSESVVGDNEIKYNTQNPIQNVCKDGSLSHSTGRGTCSGHGGIKR